MVDVKRAMGIVLFLVLLVFSIFSINATAYSELEVYQDRCYPDGSLSFTVANDKTDVLNISETTLLVQNAYIRNITFVPTGTWNQSFTYYNLSEGKMYSSTFVGGENQITESGDYHLFVRYTGCREGQCKTAGYLKNCLAHGGDCYKYKPVVYGCTVDPVQRMAFIQFGGEKNKFFGEVDPARDLLFFISSDTRNLDDVRRVEGASFSKQGDVREMRFPLLKNEVLTDVAIVHTRCNSPFQQQKRMPCLTGERQEKRGIGNALTEEPVSVSTPPPAGMPDTAPPTKLTVEPDVVDAIIEQKEQETQQRVDEIQQELERTKAELDAYKQMQNQPVGPPEEGEGSVPEITGAATGPARQSAGIPTPYIIAAVLVVLGIMLVTAANMYSKKKKKEQEKRKKDEERKEKNFGFGD